MTRDERLLRLEACVQKQTALLNDLLEQIAETNLKIRFIFATMRVVDTRQATSALIGADGKRQIAMLDGYTAYMTSGRDLALAVVEKELHAYEQAAIAQAEADRIAGAVGPAGGEGDSGADVVDFSQGFCAPDDAP